MWVNQGNAGNDSDGFGATFASTLGGPAAARAVVNQAISFWQQVLPDLNYSLTVSTGGLGGNTLASTGSYETNDFVQVIAATITVGNGVNWFIDQTPADHVEFSNILATNAATGPVGGTDLLTVMLHEMGHALGISNELHITSFLADTGSVDPLDTNNPPTNVWWGLIPLNGGFPFSRASGLHLMEQPFSSGQFSSPGFPNDLMQRAVAGNTRRLISDIDAQIIDFAEGIVNVVMPSNITGLTFNAVFNPATGVLTINGDLGTTTGDDFILTKQGDSLHVIMNGSDMAFPFNSITAININSGQGNDRVQVLMSPGLPLPSDGNPIPPGATLNIIDNGPAAESDQLLFVAAGSTLYEVDGSKVVRNGSAANYALSGVEQLLTYALGNSGNGVRVDGTPAGISKMIVYSGPGNDNVDIEGVGSGTTLELNCDGGADTIFLGGLLKADMDGIQGDITLIGGGGADDDVLYVYDQSNNTTSSYVLTATEIKRGARTITHTGLEGIEMRTGDKADNFTVQGLATPTEVDTGLGADTILIDSNGSDPGGVVDPVDALFTIRGGVDAAVDTLILNDMGDSTSDIVTVTDTRIGDGPSDTFFGATGAVEYHEIEVLDILLGRDGDEVHVRATDPGTVTTINGTQGHDHIEVSSLDGPDGRIGNANGIRSQLILLGDGGNDILVLDDSTDTTTDKVTITAAQVGATAGDNYFGPGGYVDYSSFAFMTMRNGSAGDTINVQATANGTATTINAGEGDDRFEVDSNTAANSLGNVSAIVSSLVINGQDGADVAMLDDTGDAAANLYTLSDTQLGATVGDTLFGAGGLLGYSSLATLSIFNGAGGETVRVTGTATGTATTIDAGAGDDQFFVDSNGPAAGGTVDAVKSLLSILGGAGASNFLTVMDMSDASPDVFTIAAGAIGAEAGDTMFGAGGRLLYDAIAQLDVTGSSGGNTIYIRSTWTPITLNAGFNSDTVHIDSNGPAPGGTVDTIGHPLTIHGGGGQNQLRLDDAGDTSADRVTITENTIGLGPADTIFGAGGKLDFSNFSSIHVSTGTAADTIDIQSTGAGKPLAIDAGAGLDQITISATVGGTSSVELVRSQVTIHGGADGATLVLDDSGDTTADTVHVTPTMALAGDIGAVPGNNYFGAGGSVSYNDVLSVALVMGNTAGDLIVASPSPTLTGTKFAIDGNNPTSVPGDVLKVNIGGVTDVVHTPGVPGAGLYTSSDHAEIAYVEIEETGTILPVTLPADNLNNVYVVQVNEAQNTLDVFDENPPIGRPIYSAPLAGIAGLTLEMLGGDDEVVIDLGRNGAELLSMLRVDMGRGDNRVIVSGGRARMDAIATGGSLEVVVRGGAEVLTSGFEGAGLSLVDQRTKLTILPGGTQASVLTALAVDRGATLDITDNALIVDYIGTSPVATIREQLLSGRGGPGLGQGWDGTGIISSTAAAANAAEAESRSIGYAENALLPLGAYTSFRGQRVDNTAVLIAYTRTGDANLDGAVNDDDVTIVGASYVPAAQQPQWALGDFEYNGRVDDDDVTLLGAFYAPGAGGAAAPPVEGGGVSGEGRSTKYKVLSTKYELGGVAAAGEPFAQVDMRAQKTREQDTGHAADDLVELLAESIAAEVSIPSDSLSDTRRALHGGISVVYQFWPN